MTNLILSNGTWDLCKIAGWSPTHPLQVEITDKVFLDYLAFLTRERSAFRGQREWFTPVEHSELIARGCCIDSFGDVRRGLFNDATYRNMWFIDWYSAAPSPLFHPDCKLRMLNYQMFLEPDYRCYMILIGSDDDKLGEAGI